MSSVNKVILIGNLTRDPQKIDTSSGNTMVNISIATNDRRKNGETWEDFPEYHSVLTFGNQADNALTYLSKGRKVYIEGKLQTRKYTDKDGNERRKTDIIAQNIQYLSTKSEESSTGYSSSKASGFSAPTSSSMDSNEEIPF